MQRELHHSKKKCFINEYLKQSKRDKTNPYDNKEDETIIKRIEQRTGLLTGEIQKGEVTRKNHRGTLVQVEGPTSLVKTNTQD